MGHTEINAFGDCVRRIGLGRFATVVELRIPCVYAWGVSNGNVNPQTYTYYRDNEKVYVEIIKYSDCTKNTEKELRDKYENL